VFDDAVEQGVLVRGVSIDRHRVAGEGLPEPAHRQCLDTVLVDDLQGGGENLLAGQRGAPAGRLRSAGRAGVIGVAAPEQQVEETDLAFLHRLADTFDSKVFVEQTGPTDSLSFVATRVLLEAEPVPQRLVFNANLNPPANLGAAGMDFVLVLAFTEELSRVTAEAFARAAAQIALTGAITDLNSGATRVLTATIQDAAGNTVTSDSSTVVAFTFGSGRDLADAYPVAREAFAELATRELGAQARA
jgi:hypothetical protein